MSSDLSVRDVDRIDFQRKEWVFLRFGWGLLAVFLIAAMLGVFGRGYVSRATATSPDGALSIQYDHFTHYLGPTTLKLHAGAAAVEGGKLTLHIDRELAQEWQIQQVTPQPSTESSSRTELIYQFDVLGDSPPVVKIEYRGDDMGTNQGTIRAGSGAAVHLWQLTYP
jgi:hypothetical protein